MFCIVKGLVSSLPHIMHFFLVFSLVTAVGDNRGRTTQFCIYYKLCPNSGECNVVMI